MLKCLCFILVLSSFEIIRVASFNLTIKPVLVVQGQDPQVVAFICTADVALTGCQFRLWDSETYPSTKRAGHLLELSQGSQSQVNPAHLHKQLLTNYSYTGQGLEAGDCGVMMVVRGYNIWMAECRVRTEKGGWKYAWEDVYARGFWDNLSYNLKTPREVVVLPGREMMFNLKAKFTLSKCSFHLLSKSGWVYFDKGVESSDNKGRHRYLGAGLQSGDCGVALTNLSEADNGPVKWAIESAPFEADSRYMALIIARPPTAPTLNLTYTGTNVTATCEVKEGRPVAKISWVLGDDIIRQDEDDDTQADSQDEWMWPWTQRSIQQTLTLALQPQHNGKDLKCRVSHFTLSQPLEATRTLSSTGSTA